MRLSLLTVAVAFLILASTPVSATPILIGGTDDSLASLLGGFVDGYDFIPNTNQSVTALGFWDSAADGLSTSYDVGLYSTSTQTLLASATIDNSDPLDTSLTVAGGEWRYETLASPIALTAGSTYTLVFYAATDITASDAFFLAGASQISSPTVSVTSGRVHSASGLTFPTTLAGNVRGNVNAQLSSAATPVPEPASMLLLGTGLIGAAVRRYRRRSK